jgi:hypothetical protein
MSKPTVSAAGGAMPAEGHKTRGAALLRLFAGAPALAALPSAAITAVASAAAAEATPEKKIITAEQMVAMEFAPSEHTEGEWTTPSNEEWLEDSASVLPSLRMAWAAMYKTEAGLETLSRDLDDDAFEYMVDGIGYARKYFKNFVTVLEAAEIRIMCSAASALAKDDPEGLADV